MMRSILQPVTLCLLFVAACTATKYSRSDSFSGPGFLSGFSHQAIQDPTHGRVNYLSESDALSQNLTYASGNTFIMRADSHTKLDPSGPGRNSVRIQSKKQFSTHVVVMDIRHIPEGCSTWPALRERGEVEPDAGLVDIIEGVNGISPNQVTLHTTANCTMPSNRDQTGHTTSTDCNVAVNSNSGCGVKPDKANNFAGDFNSVGGGWYAMERTDTAIKVWFWARNEGSVPEDVRYGATYINTSKWGTPFANFPNTQCDIASHFKPNNIQINLTFYGDFAGNVFSKNGCGDDCDAFVNDNPSAFKNAFWDFASINVYQ